MKLVDLNVLIYATDARSKHHSSAKPWLDDAMSGTGTVALPTAVTVGYVRLTTNPAVMVEPLGITRAVEIVQSWIMRANVAVPQPTARHYELLEELVAATGTGGNLVSDAHLAALAIEHGAELVSYDSDYSRFPGLVWHRMP